MTTKKKPVKKWVAVVRLTIDDTTYQPGDPVPDKIAKTKWLRDQRKIEEAG